MSHLRRLVYIDCGAWRGTTIKNFRLSRPDAGSFEIYAFECNPLLKGFDYGPGVTTINKAVYNKDGVAQFYLSKTHAEKVQGSSMCPEKVTGNLDKDNPVTVETIDFSKWLYDNCTGADLVIVKMNIEGAEYNVIKHIIETCAVRLIDEIYIMWHWQKIGLPLPQHMNIEGALKRTGIKIHNTYEGLKACQKV